MSLPIKQISFAAGEIAPALYARTDHVKYETGLRTLRNRIVMRHGGSTKRPGTQYVATNNNAGASVRLIPFIFNETGNGQSYVLEFGAGYVAFYQNGAAVLSAGVPYTIASPYAQTDLATLDFVETNDVVTICHPNYAPYELKRVAQTNWTLAAITFGPANTAGIGNFIGPNGTAGNANWTYYITAVYPSGEETIVVTKTANSLVYPTSANPVFLSWNYTAGLTEGSYYNIYRSFGGTGASGTIQAGFIGSVIANNGGSFQDTGLTANYNITAPISNLPFVGAGNFPAVCGFIQQRRVFAATNNNPVGFWMSQTGLYANLNTRAVPIASDAIIGTLAGDELNAIKHFSELKFAVALTTGNEVYLQGGGLGVLTPGQVNAAIQSNYGSSALKPIRAGDVLLFNQALGGFVRDFAFDFAVDGYRGNDVTVFSSHLFEGFSLTDWAFQKIPDSIIWAVRSDGVLLSLTYVREQQLFAWAHHDLQNGFVENVCAIPENGNYAVYLSVKRTINGATVRYIERMSSRIWSDQINATYLDCFTQFNGVNATATTMAISVPLNANYITDDTANRQQLTLTASANYFSAANVGDSIFLSDQNFILAQGNMVDPENDGTSFALSAKGNQIRCLIVGFTDGQHVTVLPNRAVPASLQNAAITTWSRAIKKMTGLTSLIGQQVAVWADRTVVASPLNNEVSFAVIVDATGAVTLDKWYSVIYVGLPMISDLETLDIETTPGWTEALIGKRKRVTKLAVYVQNTRTFWTGAENPDSNIDNTLGTTLFGLVEEKLGQQRATYDEAPELLTGQDTVFIQDRWNKNGRVFIRDVDPVPSTILAVVPAGDSPSQPYGKKA